MPIPKPIPPKLSKSKINNGSSIIFKIVPNPATNIGSFISPSPAKIERKKPENTINGSPILNTLR